MAVEVEVARNPKPRSFSGSTRVSQSPARIEAGDLMEMGSRASEYNEHESVNV